MTNSNDHKDTSPSADKTITCEDQKELMADLREEFLEVNSVKRINYLYNIIFEVNNNAEERFSIDPEERITYILNKYLSLNVSDTGKQNIMLKFKTSDQAEHVLFSEARTTLSKSNLKSCLSQMKSLAKQEFATKLEKQIADMKRFS